MTTTDTAELVAAFRAYIAACSGPGTTLYDGHPAVLMSKGVDRFTALERERDEAREAVDAFSEICDELGCERDNEAGLQAAYDLKTSLTASQAEVERLKEDAERMDWLVSQHVEVRTPMVYGSRANFVAQTLSSEEDAEHRTDLREQIDRSRRAAIQPQVGKP